MLTRAGYMRRIGAGLYSFLPLGFRVLKKVEALVVQEMDRAGAEQVLLPAMLPAEYFKASGRWDVFGDTLIRFQDRKGGDYHLGPTHEEIITDLARREIQSWRDLPKNLYQVQTKFRDEPRPRAGLLRCREFIMKDAYSFDASEEGAEASFEKMRVAYTAIFDRAGLNYRMVDADSGSMGGSRSAEFQVLVHSGEDVIAACQACDFAANAEVAPAPALTASDKPTEQSPEKVLTPQQRSIEEVSAFLKTTAERFLKSLVYRAGERLVLVVVRGDHEVNEVKLAKVLGVSEVALADGADVSKATGAAVGFAGPVGFAGELYVDASAAAVADGICGANETDAHLVHVRHGRDFGGTVADIRLVQDGDACPRCGGSLKLYRGIEAGHIFILGTRYSEAMGATFLDQNQNKKTLVMGCYGIGVSRLVAAAVEQHNDENGLVWPMALAPYQVHVVQVGDTEDVVAAVLKLEAELEAAGVEVLVDDRDERPGVKFKDADLIGIPLRVTVGAKALKEGCVEFKPRTEPNPKAAAMLPIDGAAAHLSQKIKEALAS